MWEKSCVHPPVCPQGHPFPDVIYAALGTETTNLSTYPRMSTPNRAERNELYTRLPGLWTIRNNLSARSAFIHGYPDCGKRNRLVQWLERVCPLLIHDVENRFCSSLVKGFCVQKCLLMPREKRWKKESRYSSRSWGDSGRITAVRRTEPFGWSGIDQGFPSRRNISFLYASTPGWSKGLTPRR